MKIIDRTHIDPTALGNGILDRINGLQTNKIPANQLGQGIIDALEALPDPVITTIPPVGDAEAIDLSKIPFYELNNPGDNASDLSILWDGVLNQQKTFGYSIVRMPIRWYLQIGAVYSNINIPILKLYAYEGSSSSQPFTVYSLNSLSDTPLLEASFTGGYENWQQFTLKNQSPKYLLFETSGGILPTQMALPNATGNYTAPVLSPALPNSPFKNYTGLCGYVWNLINGNNPLTVDPQLLQAFIATATACRSFDDWNRFEQAMAQYTFRPQVPGGWGMDDYYGALKAAGLFVMGCIQSQPNYVFNAWNPQNAQYPPVTQGANMLLPQTWINYGKIAYQWVGRYGKNTQCKGLSVDPSIPGTIQNVIKAGLGFADAIEINNEQSRYWKGDIGYTNAWEYAACMSVAWDGHMNTLGANIGAKNADPNTMVVMGGLDAPMLAYVRAMVDWFKTYRSDGKICFDAINYHDYMSKNDTGVCPEQSGAYEDALAFVAYARQLNVPVFMSEVGYDEVNGSPIYANSIGNKTTAQVKADWLLRTALMYSRAQIQRVFMYQAYDDLPGNATEFETSGIIGKLAATYLQFANKHLGTFVSTDSEQGVTIDTYTKNTYVLLSPTMNGTTISYNFGKTGTVYSPDGTSVKTTGVINVSETPVIFIAQ